MDGIPKGKNAQITISLDGARRVVLPKALRESLHLLPGEPLVAERRDDEIVIRRKEQAPGLVLECGMLVYDSGMAPASVDTLDWIDRDRDLARRILEPGR